ncbi:diacylglycerol/lipid kinase family protein [Hellea balneolensis]|uniref:diacylglycerol/lipid kinase family protein n=1 Tax=Hellea balneolensis TaxID=287478 RepID=UPI00041B4663|nr:diacylglycerol kinase family protein [Hellea balneolensis]
MPAQHTEKRYDYAGGPPFIKPSIIINTAAGSTSDITPDIIAMFKDNNYPKPYVHLCDPSELTAALTTVETDGTDLLVIYGGDGTCKAGAVTARKLGIPLIPLPGGTMNMLPRAVFGLTDWHKALELALSCDKPRWQAAGLINENIFFCGAILGDPITMAEARESLREGHVVEAVKHIPEIISAISDGEEFEFKADGKIAAKHANGLQIYCPYMTEGANVADAFEIASVPQLSISNLVEIGGRAIAQNWRESPHIKTALVSNVEITGQGAFDILLDGERETISCPLSISLKPEGVLVLAPELRAH